MILFICTICIDDGEAKVYITHLMRYKFNGLTHVDLHLRMLILGESVEVMTIVVLPGLKIVGQGFLVSKVVRWNIFLNVRTTQQNYSKNSFSVLR